MPTDNPRITVTLSPEVHALLRRLSALTDNSQSAIVGGLLETSVSVFQRLIDVMEAAEQAQGRLNEEVRSTLAGAQARLEDQLGLAMETLDDGFRPILKAAEGVRRRAPKAGSTPVPVTRGSGSPTAPQPKGKRTVKRGSV